MTWLRRLVASIGKDKFVHTLKGLVTFTLALLISGHPMWSFLFAVSAAIALEIYQDITKTGKKETADALADTLGAIIGLVIFYSENIHNYLMLCIKECVSSIF